MELEMKESKKFEPVSVPNNVYLAQVIEIEELDLEHGATLSFNFEIIQEGAFKETKLNGLCSAKLTSKTKLYTWAKALGINLNIGEKLNTNIFKGKFCKIVTLQETKNDKISGTFTQSKVTSVLPPDQGQLEIKPEGGE